MIQCSADNVRYIRSPHTYFFFSFLHFVSEMNWMYCLCVERLLSLNTYTWSDYDYILFQCSSCYHQYYFSSLLFFFFFWSWLDTSIFSVAIPTIYQYTCICNRHTRMCATFTFDLWILHAEELKSQQQTVQYCVKWNQTKNVLLLLVVVRRWYPNYCRATIWLSTNYTQTLPQKWYIHIYIHLIHTSYSSRQFKRE